MSRCENVGGKYFFTSFKLYVGVRAGNLFRRMFMSTGFTKPARRRAIILG